MRSISIAAAEGDQQVRGMAELPGDQGQTVDVAIPPGVKIEVGRMTGDGLTGLFAVASGQASLEIGDSKFALDPGKPVVWYEGIGSKRPVKSGGWSQVLVENLSDAEIKFSFRTSQRLSSSKAAAQGDPKDAS